MILFFIVFFISIINPINAKNSINSGDRLFYKTTEENTILYNGELSRYRLESEYIFEVTYINNDSVGVKEFQGSSITHQEKPILKEYRTIYLFQTFYFIDLDNIESVYDSWFKANENSTNAVSVSAEDRTLYAKLEVENSSIWYGTNYTGSEYSDFVDYGNYSLTIKASYAKNSVLNEYTFEHKVIGEYVQQNRTKEIVLTDTTSLARMNFIPIIISLMICSSITIIILKRRSRI